MVIPFLERRFKQISLSQEDLIMLFNIQQDGVPRRIMINTNGPLPEDARVVDVFVKFEQMCIGVIIWSSEFSIVPEGATIEYFDGDIAAKMLSVEPFSESDQVRALHDKLDGITLALTKGETT